jgi:hypothetical protein
MLLCDISGIFISLQSTGQSRLAKENIMTLFDRITVLEAAIASIENNPDSVIGGSKEYFSGRKTYFKTAAQRKLDSLNKQLNALLDQCEA